MRTKLKKLTSVCLAVIMILGMLTVAPITTSAAEETGESVSETSGDFEYELYDDGTLSITGYSGNAANLTIPSEIDGYTVTEIGWYAFTDNTSLTSVTIPDTVTYIGGYAFEDCENLASVIIPDSVTYIGYYAFANTALSSIAIPASVTSIDEYAFAGCKTLKSVTIPSSVQSIGEYAFADCQNLKSVTIPASVTNIGDCAFGYIIDEDEWEYVKVDGFKISGYTNSRAEVYASDNGFKFVSLGEVSPFVYEVKYDDTISITGYNGKETNLTIPSEIDGYTVTEIGYEAFYDNTSLTSVTIPDTVTSIGGNAFQDCENLASATIPDSVTYIGYSAFENTALSGITIPDSVTSISGYAFFRCVNLKSVTIPASVTNIGYCAFGYIFDEDEWEYVKADGFTISGYTNSRADLYAYDNGIEFESIGVLPPFVYELNDDNTISITGYIGREANLIIPSEIDGYTVTQIGWSAFSYNTRLKSVTIPDTVTYIGGNAFRDCVNLASATIPDSVTYIGYRAFESTALSSITIPDSVTDICGSAFQNCENLTSVTIPDSVTYIGNNAFESTALSSITIPSSVTSIEEYAFADCANLKSVTIPSSVTHIGEYAFGYIYSEDSWEYEKVDGFTISGYTNSRADVYAYDNGFKFVSVGEIPPFVYEVNYDDTISITGYIGREENLTIPSEIDGYTVTEIGSSAFWGNTSLKSVTIPDSVTYIGNNAFESTALSSITIPASVTSIDEYAFADCANLKSVTIPSSVTHIGEYAFGYIYSEDSREYEKVDGFTISGYTNSRADVYAYDNGFKFVSVGEIPPFVYEVNYDDTISITGYKGRETNLTIPSEIDGYIVTDIGWYAFSDNTRLKSVTIPDTVTSIGGYAFRDCVNLASATIPDSVTYIGYRAFESTALSSITIPSSVTIIEDYAFADCQNLKSVTIPSSVQSIGEYAFGYVYENNAYEAIDGFTISGYTNSRADLYASDNGFKFVSLGEVSPFVYEVNYDDIISITGYNGKESNLTIPSEIDGYTVEEIGGNAFYGNTRLKSVTIPDTVKYINDYAFQDCKNLASATIPDSVTRIGYDAFESTALSSITIPAGVTSIGEYAFADCANLKSVTIPASVTYIGEDAFGYIYDYDEYEYVKADGFTISGYAGSEAEIYANENGFTFINLSEEPTQKLGDVNGDGEISVDDITAIQKYLVNLTDLTDEQLTLADVDKDGEVLINDATLIQKYLIGLAEI